MKSAPTRMSRGAPRPVAGREQILGAARAIGISDGWSAVTIRAVAAKLGYTAPLLYEHFRDKGDILTQLAIEGQVCLENVLSQALPGESGEAIQVMVERFWLFMLENRQLYRLMNGMDGVPIDREAVTAVAERIFVVPAKIVERWFVSHDAAATGIGTNVNEIWALLHGMATLYLDRSIPFTLQQAQQSVLCLLRGHIFGENR